MRRRIATALGAVRLALGILCIALGAVTAIGPFSSVAGISVLVGLGLILVGAPEMARVDPVPMKWLSIGWLVAGVAVLAWPGVTTRVLAVVAGVALVAGGAWTVAAKRVVPGVASGALGILLVSWPGVTAFVIATAFGCCLVVLGFVNMFPGLQFPTKEIVALVAALAVLSVGVPVHAAQPRPDAFFTSPAGVPAQPGVLLREQAYPRGAPPGARAWRILYTTTRDDHTPAVASALVLASDRIPAGPRPVIAWAHGATGIARGCAPSLLPDPLGSGAMPGLDEVLGRGWVVVATDYTGLGTPGPHPFLIGQGEARSVLDAVRAARHLTAVTLDARTVVWGHSQGGNAALWTGILAPGYAPDAGVLGVAALAPGSDLPALARLWGAGKGRAIFGAYLVEAYSDTYPDVRFGSYVKGTARIQVRELAGRCLSESRIYLSGFSALLFGQSIWATDPATGAFGTRLRENVPTGPIPVPVLVAQGLDDQVVPAGIQAGYVQQRCGEGGRVDYRTYPGRDHVGLLAAGSPMVPDLLRWTQDRLDGTPDTATCPA
jgi:alpha-beta hydrolase superfamily lysophospholipase/uncharacterized membrane protein HdeD (DUF308 family)